MTLLPRIHCDGVAERLERHTCRQYLLLVHSGSQSLARAGAEESDGAEENRVTILCCGVRCTSSQLGRH